MTKGMNIIEKILARASGKSRVVPGDLIWVNVDIAMIHDSSGPRRFKDSFRELGNRFFDPDKVVVITEHFNPPANERHASIQKLTREWVKENNLKNFYDLEGVCHQVLREKGYVLPGKVITGADSHTCTGGALGALAIGIGSTDMLGVLVTGKTWIRVPETIKVIFSGKMTYPVMAKDLILKLINKLGHDGATYKALEFSGSAIKEMPIDERLVLTNMSIECGAKTGIIEADEKVFDYVNKVSTPDQYEVIKSDNDAAYQEILELDANGIEPMIAMPHMVDNCLPVSEVKKIPIDQAYIGSCTGGKYTDLVAAASILKDRKVAPGVRLMVAPASREVYLRVIEEGILKVLVESGARLLPNSCGACAGLHSGLLAAGERCISSTNRNFKGRMGHNDSEVYLASPATVAASAVAGKITDPREFIGGGDRLVQNN